eukprot:scaffold11323_cov69-Skeletonema_dohrnii-CCMP3373.AAC.3
MVIDAEHTTSHHSPSGPTTRPFTSVSSRQYIHSTIIMTGNHWWKGRMSRRSRLESRNIISSSGEDINVSIRMHVICAHKTNEGEMKHWWAFRPVEQNETSDMSQ